MELDANLWTDSGFLNFTVNICTWSTIVSACMHTLPQDIGVLSLYSTSVCQLCVICICLLCLFVALSAIWLNAVYSWVE